MTTNVTFTGILDNGHDYYQVDALVEVSTQKDYLTKDEVLSIVDALKRADRKKHGKSYRGDVISFEVSDDEFVRQVDEGHIFIEDGDAYYTIPEDYNWLNNFYACSRDIEHCSN